MGADGVTHTGDQEQEPMGPEELSAANDLMLAIVRTAKGLKIYLPNNPVLIKFVEDLASKMIGHIGEYGTFRLEVDRFTLSYKGSVVYENQDPKESLAFRLHADGIGALFFSPGLEQREIMAFLDAIGFDRKAYGDEDIVTRLWEKSLTHIGYLLEEDYAEAEPEPEETVGTSQQEAITGIYSSLVRGGVPPLRTIPVRLLKLSAEEADWLRTAKQAEAQRSPLNDVINIVCAILVGAREPGLFNDFIEIVSNLAGNMFLAAEMAHALKLVRFLDKLKKVGNISAGQRELVQEALSGVLSDRSLEVLQETLDSGDQVSQDELKELLHILGLPCLSAICELLGRAETLRVRKVIIEVLVELGKDDPEVFAPFLSDPRWYLVRNVVLVLSLIETQVALDMIVGLITHKEARIRKEVLGFLERSPDPKAKSYILKFFRDESSALRLKALQILAREKQGFALKPAVALTQAPDFKSMELADRKAVYEAIGELGSQHMVPMFRDMLARKHWFSSGVDKEEAICAVAGLSRMRTPAALELLEEARKQRNPEVRALAEQAIQAFATGKGRAPAEKGEL